MEPRPGKRRFAGIPHHVMKHPDYIALSNGARSLLLELSMQYNSHNNGDLSASFSLMRSRGVTRSKTTLTKWLKELEARQLIARTREGIFTNPGGRCALYALTWNAVDQCPGKHLDVKPTNAPLRSFSADIIKMPGPKIDTGGTKKWTHEPLSGAKN